MTTGSGSDQIVTEVAPSCRTRVYVRGDVRKPRKEVKGAKDDPCFEGV